MTEWTQKQKDDLADFVEEVGIAIAAGVVPFLAQAIDIYDTAWAAYDLYETRGAALEHREEAYFDVALALIGWIPGPGDGIKKTLKTVNKDPERFAPLMLDVVRQALYAAGYKVDPYQFLMDSISEGKIRELMDNAKQVVVKSRVYRASPELVQSIMLAGIEMAGNSLPMLVGVVERKVRQWLHTSRRSTAATDRTPPKVSTNTGGDSHGQTEHAQHTDKPAHQPPSHQQGNANKQVGHQGEAEPTQAHRGNNAQRIAMVALNKVQESIGEHVADYHCHDTLGWGKANSSDALHDHNQATSGAKLSDLGRLRKLNAPVDISRGQGIDAIWHSRATRPYAITEYKARATPMTAAGVKGMLLSESVQDKSLQPAHRRRQSQYRREQKAGTAMGPKPELASDVPKMSHLWIEQRVEKASWLSRPQKEALRRVESYSRHVILVVTTLGDGMAHSKELAKALSEGRVVDQAAHARHDQGVFTFGDLQQVFTERSRSEQGPSDRPKRSGKPTSRSAGRTR